MYIWNDIAKRYCGLDGFPFDDRGQKKVWNAWQLGNMPKHEKIVLLSTMDFATASGKDIEAVCAAFEQYGQEHPNSSLAEQASLLRAAGLGAEDLAAWNQTSVSEFWGSSWDEEKDDTVWYDAANDDKHFDICSELAP